ncbi:hypothetical protein [Asaia spathodeae]|uniref:Uncharacterized protein n=1 Tax=Asaia spathodeae TaxID=657016 RepID=A0ABX2P8W7_9PROT|nr:hypothetical protein [Asaia spathodeae]GBR20964.1 hypothetical protein AA105894_2680 [Asaia spathodeae NBRC 105894]
MTHEQKPESVAFPDAVRSRYSSAKERYGITLCPSRSWEEQAKAMTRMVLDGVCEQRGHDFTAAYLAEHLAEAEARGAAEQRKRAAIEDEAESIRFADADEENTLKALMRRHGIDREEASDELNWWQERDKRFPLNKSEQRRKDAEGAEPVGYRMGPLKSSPDNGPWLSTTWLIQAAPPPPMPGVRIEPLYTRPANVAALEARVRELEGAITALFDGQACFENLGFEDPPLRVVVYDDEQVAAGKDPIGVAVKGAKIIAAALRDGGE